MNQSFSVNYNHKTSHFTTLEEMMSDIRAHYLGKCIEITVDDADNADNAESTDVYVDANGDFYTSPSKVQPYDMLHFMLTGSFVLEDV